MAERSYKRNQTTLDPLFPIPEGAEEEFVYEVPAVDVDERIETSSDDIVGDELREIDADVVEWVDEGQSGNAILPTPEEFFVLSQTIRRAPGGQTVVDVVIQVDDMGIGANYEIRVTKV